jgi:hypothetical protein
MCDFSGDQTETLVVAKVRERLSISKRGTQKFDMDALNPKKLKEVGSRT